MHSWNCLPSPMGDLPDLYGLVDENNLLPSWGMILSPPNLREEILFFLSGIILPLSWIISPRSKG